ncbi:MAG: GntR family transcriptional regulator [Anaerolineae bacterium]
MALQLAGKTRDIERGLIFRIESGQLKPGSRMPSVRELARELGVNKNTVAQAYQSLARQGYVHAVVGKGMYVSDGHREPRAIGVPVDMERQLVELFWRAKTLGLSADDASELAQRTLHRVYAPQPVHIAFVECSAHDAETTGRQVEQAVGVPVRYLLLHDFVHELPKLSAELDIVATTLYHLAVVKEAVAAAGSGIRVVAVHAPPRPAGLLRIAQAPAGSRILVVATEETTLNTVANHVRTYNASVDLQTFWVGRDVGLVERLRDVDYVIDTHTSHQAVWEVSPVVPVITLDFDVDQQSLDYLRGQVVEVLQKRLLESVPLGVAT